MTLWLNRSKWAAKKLNCNFGIQLVKSDSVISYLTIYVIVRSLSLYTMLQVYCSFFINHCGSHTTTHKKSTDKDSFDSVSYWIKEVKDITTKNAIIVLVGNKSDLEPSRVIKKEEGEKLGKENNIIFLEVSAKTGDNIAAIFDKIGHQVVAEEPNADKQKPTDGIFFMSVGFTKPEMIVVHLETPLDFAAGAEKKDGTAAAGTTASHRRRTCCSS